MSGGVLGALLHASLGNRRWTGALKKAEAQPAMSGGFPETSLQYDNYAQRPKVWPASTVHYSLIQEATCVFKLTSLWMPGRGHGVAGRGSALVRVISQPADSKESLARRWLTCYKILGTRPDAAQILSTVAHVKALVR